MLVLLLAAVNYIVALFKRDDIQKGLNRSLFGHHAYYDNCKTRFEQRDAFKKLAGAN